MNEPALAARDPNRWLTVMLPIACSTVFSVIGASITVSWMMSSTFAHLQDQAIEQEKRLQTHSERLLDIEHAEKENAGRLGAIEQAQKDGQARGNDRDARLLRIESKIDALILDARRR